MKTKITLLLLLSVCCLSVRAQIPNAGFENWTSGEPNGWYTYNSLVPGLVAQVSGAHSGSSAAQLNVLSFIGTPTGGAMWSGTVANSFYFPVSSAPVALHGWYKFHSVSSTESFVILSGTKSAGTATGSAAGSISTNTLVYTEFVANYNYITTSADSVFIFLSLSASDSSRVGTYATIDDLSFGPASTGINELNSSTNLEPCSPNPATQVANIIYSINGSSKVNLALYDMVGKNVRTLLEGLDQTTGRYKIPVDVSDLPEGVYFYRLTVNGQTYTRKLVVAR